MLVRCAVWVVPTLLAIFPPQVVAADFIEAKGSHPIVGLFGLPQPRGSSTLLHDSFSLTVDYSNIFSGGITEDENLLLDGETSRTTLYLNKVLSACWSSALELPFVSHSGGTLDQGIETWHEIFRLPSAHRELTTQDLLEYSYSKNGRSISLKESVGHVGDVSLQFVYRTSCLAKDSIVTPLSSSHPATRIDAKHRNSSLLRFGAKIGTGELATLTGSDGVDLFVEVIGGSKPITDSVSIRSRAGFTVLGKSELFESLNPLVVFGTHVIAWKPLQDWQFLAQFDWNSPFFKSELVELGDWAVQFGAAARWTGWKNHHLELGFLEDIVIDTTPDLVIHARYGFKLF